MTTVTCPMTDKYEHKLFDTTCPCGCTITFEEGNMIIHHQPYDESYVEGWGVFESDKFPGIDED
jgi:hypothetical protein